MAQTISWADLKAKIFDGTQDTIIANIGDVDNCGFCQSFDPVYNSVANSYASDSTKFYKVPVDITADRTDAEAAELQAIINELKIESAPTIVAFSPNLQGQTGFSKSTHVFYTGTTDGSAGDAFTNFVAGLGSKFSASGASQLDEAVAMVDDDGELAFADEQTPPAEQTTPPAEQTTPPAEQTTPPAEQTTQPAEQTTQPAEQTTQPAEQTAAEPTVDAEGNVVLPKGNTVTADETAKDATSADTGIVAGAIIEREQCAKSMKWAEARELIGKDKTVLVVVTDEANCKFCRMFGPEMDKAACDLQKTAADKVVIARIDINIVHEQGSTEAGAFFHDIGYTGTMGVPTVIAFPPAPAGASNFLMDLKKSWEEYQVQGLEFDEKTASAETPTVTNPGTCATNLINYVNNVDGKGIKVVPQAVNENITSTFDATTGALTPDPNAPDADTDEADADASGSGDSDAPPASQTPPATTPETTTPPTTQTTPETTPPAQTPPATETTPTETVTPAGGEAAAAAAEAEAGYAEYYFEGEEDLPLLEGTVAIEAASEPLGEFDT
eukprot:tig00021795_g23538.t1